MLLEGCESRELCLGLSLSSTGCHVLASDAHGGRHGVALWLILRHGRPHRRAELAPPVQLLVPGELGSLLYVLQVAHDVGMVRAIVGRLRLHLDVDGLHEGPCLEGLEGLKGPWLEGPRLEGLWLATRRLLHLL